MQPIDSTTAATAAILNAAYLVRIYDRPGQARQRDAALVQMGLAARAAFAGASDAALAGLLFAIADGLLPFDARIHDRRR